MKHGTDAHGARLQSDVESSAWQAVISHLLCGITERSDFGMRRRVMATDRTIESTSDHRTVTYHHRTYRHLAQRGCLTSQIQCHGHEKKIGIHKDADYHTTARW
jgi:hypothetical protein